MKIEAYGQSHRGLVRGHNEDAWMVLKKKRFCALADGIGGHRGGGVASKLAIDTLKAFMSLTLPNQGKSSQGELACDVEALLRRGIQQSNQAIYKKSLEEESLSGMGTTLCCLHVQPNRVVYAHVGDSRLYRLRYEAEEPLLEQLTCDHSLVAELQSAGQLEEWQGRISGLSHVITRALGPHSSVEASIASCEPRDRDLYLLCTDGLTDLITDRDIQTILEQQAPLSERAEALIQAACRAGGSDNITVILVAYDSEG